MRATKGGVAALGAAALLTTSAAAPAAAQEADHLQRILDAGRIVMSTDALYPPQSFIDENTGDIVGFDIDVGQAIADRLGVIFVPYATQWDIVASGRWANRWDFSVGSMAITVPRMEAVDFTQGYRFDQAGMALREGVEVSGPEDFANLTACVGSSTTYFFWLEGTLDLGERTAEYVVMDPPAFGDIQTRETDRICADE